MRILVLGGAGAMAGVAARDLLESRVERIGLADVKLALVRERARKLGDDRVETLEADAKDRQNLKRVMKDWDVIINCTWYELNLAVMSASIGAGVGYLDLGGLYHVTLEQLALDKEARDAGVTCLLGMGSSPGVTNLMAAHGARKMSKIDEVKIKVGGTAPGRHTDAFRPPYSFRTIVDEASLPAAIFTKGEIQMVPAMSHREEFVLPDPVGKVEGFYTLHSELATLPQNLEKGVQEMNFVVAFAPEFARMVSMMVKLGLTSKQKVKLASGGVVPYDLLMSLVDASGPAETENADYGIRRVELAGEISGEPARLVYDCASGPHARWGIGGRALGTGVPASLGAQWLANGLIHKTGVLPPELCIDSERFLHELGENGRGVNIFVDDGRLRKQL